jgi:hypothetical protein
MTMQSVCRASGQQGAITPCSRQSHCKMGLRRVDGSDQDGTDQWPVAKPGVTRAIQGPNQRPTIRQSRGKVWAKVGKLGAN